MANKIFQWSTKSSENYIRENKFVVEIHDQDAHLTLSSSLSLSLKLSHSHDLSDQGPFHSPLRVIIMMMRRGRVPIMMMKRTMMMFTSPRDFSA